MAQSNERTYHSYDTGGLYFRPIPTNILPGLFCVPLARMRMCIGEESGVGGGGVVVTRAVRVFPVLLCT